MTKLNDLMPDPVLLAKGIQRITLLPTPGLARIWDSIMVDRALKDRLRSQAVLNFTARSVVDRSILPLHGVILLVGPPGTGKTSLARGLADQTARAFPNAKFRLVEVEPHSLTSSAMGKTQRAVSDLFEKSIAESAIAGPTIVLLDEVETLAADRSKMSMEANPVDVHRATDAVLVQLDALAERYPHLLFIATSNFPKAVDAAFTSRCDLVASIPLPDEAACESILKDSISGLAHHYPRLGALLDASLFSRCVSDCVGLDGRAIRKVVGNALASRPQTAADPNLTTVEDLHAAILNAKAERSSGAYQ